MWLAICMLVVLLTGGVVSCALKDKGPFQDSCVLVFIMGLGYFIRWLFTLQ